MFGFSKKEKEDAKRLEWRAELEKATDAERKEAEAQDYERHLEQAPRYNAWVEECMNLLKKHPDCDVLMMNEDDYAEGRYGISAWFCSCWKRTLHINGTEHKVVVRYQVGKNCRLDNGIHCAILPSEYIKPGEVVPIQTDECKAGCAIRDEGRARLNQ